MESHLTARIKVLTPNVYPNVAPKKYSTPCVVYQLLDTETFNDLSGYSTDTFKTFQLAVSSPIYAEAQALAAAVRQSLSGWSTNSVKSVSWLDEVAAVDNTTDVTLHRFILIFRFYVSG